MNVYTKQHSYYCGIDLHARTMYVCILDTTGKKMYHKNIPCKPENVLKKKFIFRFITVPAKWIHSGRQNILKLYTHKDYQLLLK